MDDANRHALQFSVEQYIEDRTPGVFKLAGDPTGLMTIDPLTRSLGLRFPAQAGQPDLRQMANVEFDSILDGAALWHVLTVKFGADVADVFSVLCSIADRVQLHGESFASAVTSTLDNLASILDRRSAPTIEQQVGLAGELLMVHAVATQLGLDAAAKCWLGPSGEEHDVRLHDVDLEVKTTTGERRTHWISSITQLMPSGTRPLYLVSVQLTRAGATDGWTLPELIDRIRHSHGPSTEFDSRLSSTAFRSAQPDLFSTRWAMRATPNTYLVDSAFPAVTRSSLEGVTKAHHLITDLRYQIDVAPLPTSDILDPIIGSLEQFL